MIDDHINNEQPTAVCHSILSLAYLLFQLAENETWFLNTTRFFFFSLKTIFLLWTWPCAIERMFVCATIYAVSSIQFKTVTRSQAIIISVLIFNTSELCVLCCCLSSRLQHRYNSAFSSFTFQKLRQSNNWRSFYSRLNIDKINQRFVYTRTDPPAVFSWIFSKSFPFVQMKANKFSFSQHLSNRKYLKSNVLIVFLSTLPYGLMENSVKNSLRNGYENFYFA